MKKLIGLHSVLRPDFTSLLILSSNGAMCRSADHDLGLNVTKCATPTRDSNPKGQWRSFDRFPRGLREATPLQQGMNPGGDTLVACASPPRAILSGVWW